MVNKKVMNYLKKYKGKYPVSALKKKLISSGYSKQEVEEAAKLLGGNQAANQSQSQQKPATTKQVKQQPQPKRQAPVKGKMPSYQPQQVKQEEGKKKSKWWLWLIIIFLVLVIIGVVLWLLLG